jgi:Cu/Ag efflux pump CusA
MPVQEALMTSGARRLKPIFLTSVTTIAGLAPMLLEKSFQAQVLIPMANSLAFGLLASTVLVLFIVPFLFKIYAQLAFSQDEYEGKWESEPEPETTTTPANLSPSTSTVAQA